VTLCERRRLRADELIHEGHDFAATQNVCLWHKADISRLSSDVRLRGKALDANENRSGVDDRVPMLNHAAVELVTHRGNNSPQ